MLATIARNDRVPVVMVNQVGGNDSLLFDGSSLVLNREGKVIAQGKSFEEDIIYFDSATLRANSTSRSRASRPVRTARWFLEPATTSASADSGRSSSD